MSGRGADQRADDGGQQHDCRQHDPGSIADLVEEGLPGPGGDAGIVDALTDHEQRRDEDHDRIAESGQRIGHRQHTGGPEGEGREDGDRADRDLVPDEDRDHHDEEQQTECCRVHQGSTTPFLTGNSLSVGSLDVHPRPGGGLR